MSEKHTPGLFVARPALKSFIAYTAGILAGEYMPVIPLVAISLALIFAVSGLILHLKKKSVASTLFLFLALAAAGTAEYRLATSGFPPTHVKHIAISGNMVTVTGEIAAEPDIRSDRTYFIVDVDSLNWRQRDFESCGRIMLKVKQPVTTFDFRDRIKFSGSLFEPGGAHNPGGFDFSRWLSDKEIFGMVVLDNAGRIEHLPEKTDHWWEFDGIKDIERLLINRVVAPLRHTLLDGYDKYLPADQASLLAGFVLGEKREMPAATERLFRDTGTLHLMAVSGSNVAIVVGFFLTITCWLNRRLRILITFTAIIFFSFLTRNEPSVVRASVMAGTGLLGFYRYKNPDIMGLLGFSGFILLIINPLWIYSIGFQLSFAACFGIIYLLPLFLAKIKRTNSFFIKIFHWIVFTFLATLSAQIMVMPLTAEYFNRLPLLGMLANIPMIALASILTVAGICFLPFIILGNAFATIFAWPLSRIISMIVPLLDFFVDLPYSVINIYSPGWLKIIMFYSGLYLIMELISSRRTSCKAMITLLLALSGLVWTGYLKGPTAESLTFVDCNTDRAVIFHDQEGHAYLWYDCWEPEICTQIDKSLLPYLLKANINQVDTVFTCNISKIGSLSAEIDIKDIVEHSSIKLVDFVKIEEFSPYFEAESILNKTVKFVGIKTDNNSETLTDGLYYKLSTSGGDCILAGSINPRFAGAVNREAEVLELPWNVQAYGTVYRSLKEAPPQMLVFSPSATMTAAVGGRDRLTYFADRTWAVAFSGNFRIRFAADKMHVDYMLEP